MTEIFQYNSVVNKKPKKNILNHLKHYLSNSLVHHHHHHHEKPPKSIECRQTTITNSNEVLHSKMITSSKLLTNQCHTNSWTIKQFKKRLKLLHNNKFKQKSTTLCIEPSKVIQSIDSYELHQHYHTMKESLNEKHHMNTSIDNISLQLSSMHSSLSLNECNNIEEENKMYHTKITNLDEDELDKIIPNESINTLDYINTILNESNIDHTLYDYHHDHDHQQHHLQHYQQQHQQHHHRYPHQRQYKQQYDKYSLNQLTSFNNQLLSTSDIYSIFTSYDKLNDYSNLSLNKSIINNQSSFSLNKSIINNSINQTNLITTTTTLNKVNAINKTNQLIKKYFHLSNKLKTLSSMIDINKQNPSECFNEQQSLHKTLNRPKSYYNQEINHKTTDNINNSSNHINIDNINSLLSLTSSNCNNDYTSKEINISNQSNQLINRLPNTLTIKSIKNTNRLLTNSPHRSTSLIRYQQHNLHDPLREQSIDHDISLSFMPNLCNFDSKSSSLSKESGGKKFLNFLQRGFQSKRPKSMVKSERRRNAKNRSDYVFSSDHYLSRSSSIHSNSMAILCLGEQIQLPKELYNAFSLKPTEFSLTSSEASDENVDDVSHLVQICNIDPSLIGNNCSYYFQVMSPSRKMIKPSSIQLNSSYKQINDVQCSHTSNLIQTTNDSKDNIKEIVNIPFVIHNYSCSSALERDRWVQFLKRLINPSQDAQRRKENCLNIWIQEAKGLAVKNRYYCTILVNGTICARTTIKQMTDMLFWGEEFDLSGLTNCSDLSIEIWRACDTKTSSPSHRHRTTSPHRMSSNHRQQTNTSPLPMRKAMMACTKATDDGSVSPPDFTAFRNSIILDDLSITNTITDEETSRQKRRKFKSSKVAKPSLIATVHISLLDLSNSGEVESWYTPNLSDESKLSTGQLKQPDGKISGESNVNKTKSKGRRSSRRDNNLNLVQIRVKIRYRTVTVLPLTSYARLESNLCQFQLPKAASFFTDIDKLHNITLGANSLSLLSTSNKPDLIHLLSSLDPWLNVKAKAELAGAIVVLQQARGQVTEFLSSLILCEVKKQSDPNMVLRANSIATKATEIYLRLVGGSYLSNILSEFVQVVINGRTADSQLKTSNRYPIDYEVDIAKVQTSTQLAQNQVNLLSLVELVWKRILLSEVEFPEQFRALFVEIRQYLDVSKSNCSSVNNVHNNNSDGFNSLSSSSSSPATVNGTLCEHVISACLFLRYICPAILSPSLFNLTHEFPSEPRVLRAFTLVAKTIQTLANFSLFSGSKEAYMKFMNQFVSDQLPAMRQFLQSISTPCAKSTSLQRLSKNSTVLKPINSLSNIYNSPVNNNSTNGSMPHSLHIVGSDENCIKSTLSISKGKIRDSSTGNNHFLNNSQSHHGGFICDTDCQDILIDSRKSPDLEINKVNDTKPNVNSSFKQQKYQDTTLVSNSISLPPLPTNQHAHLGIRDHVDLPLCLALCHLQLSEAIQKVPEDKRIPDVNELKSILDEVDMFLASGKDPQPNWWNDKIVMNDHHHHHHSNNNNNNNNKQNSTILIKNNSSTIVNEETHRNNLKPSHVHLLNNQSNCTANKSNDAYIYEYTYNSNKSKLMNTSSSNKSINVSDGGTISLKSSSNLSVTSLISPKQAGFPEKNYYRSNNYAEQSTITSDSNIEFEVLKGKQYSPIMQEPAIRYDSLEIIKTPHSNDVNVNSEQIFKAVNKSIPSHTSILSNNNESRKFVESNHDFASVTRRDNRRRVQYPRKTQEPIIICKNNVDDSNNNVCVDSSSVIGQLSHHHSSPVDICDDVNAEHTEHSEIGPVYFGNSSSGYHTMSSHGNILNDLPIMEQKSSIIEPIISTPDDVIMTSLSTTPMDISSMNNPVHPCHSTDSYSNYNIIQDQVTTLNNVDPSFSACNQPKKSMQNSNRRHTYVNLSNSHETDHLIDALMKDNSTNSTVNNNVNHVELDKRNWAPPVYLSNEQKNRRLTLTHPKYHGYASSPTGLINYPTTRNYGEHNDFNYYGVENINYPDSLKFSPSEQELHRNSTLQGEIQRMKFIPTNTPYTIGPTPNKRTGLFSSENNAPTSVMNLQSELDASQARLAEAQARLLANEAERVQILKLWQSELIKQTQLINASKTVHNNTISSNLQFTSDLQLTGIQNDDLQDNPDDNDNFDENEPRSMSVIPLLPLNGLKSQDYSESIYDYEDSELMHHNNDEQNKQSFTDTNIKLNASNGVNRNFGLHALQPGSHMKSLRSHSNQPRMGASAIVTNLHDYHGTGVNNYLQSTIPRSRIMSNRSYKSHNTTTSIASTTRAELGEFCRISRSPSTPGLSNINYTHTVLVHPADMDKLNTTDNPIDPPPPLPPTDEEFARQIQAIVNENNQHLHSE